jgi:hypothetical protein
LLAGDWDDLPEMRTHLSKIEDYPAFLDACWQEHLKPRESNAPIVMLLFAGMCSR